MANECLIVGKECICIYGGYIISNDAAVAGCLLSIQRTWGHNCTHGSYKYIHCLSTMFVLIALPRLFHAESNEKSAESTVKMINWYPWNPLKSQDCTSLRIRNLGPISTIHTNRHIHHLSLGPSCYKCLTMMKHRLPSSSLMSRPVVPQKRYQLKPPCLW